VKEHTLFTGDYLKTDRKKGEKSRPGNKCTKPVNHLCELTAPLALTFSSCEITGKRAGFENPSLSYG